MPRLSHNKIYRFLEIIPGALVWGTLFGSIVLSYFAPLIAIYIIILFDLYWLVKAVYWLVYLFGSYRNYRRDTRINWFEKLKQEKIISSDNANSSLEDLYHLIFLPTYKEPFNVLDTTFNALIKSNYPTEKMMIALGVEEWDKEKGTDLP